MLYIACLDIVKIFDIACYSMKVCEWPNVNMTYTVICVICYGLRHSTGGRVWST